MKYKIIIPKEESKQEKFEHIPYKGNVWEPPVQETLEEAAERIYDDNLFNYEKYRDGFIKGAKWQTERMYSEEEVIELLHKRMRHTLGEDYKEEITLKWFGQFKK